MVRTINKSKDIYSSTNKMSDNGDNVEQITKTPSNVLKREKDPKRVAAGKKLAESNKRMREEHARYKALEVQRTSEAPPETTESETNDGEWLSKLSLTNVISLVGIGLAVFNIYMRYQDTNKKHVAWHEPVTTTFEEPEVDMRPKPKQSMKPKFGM